MPMFGPRPRLQTVRMNVLPPSLRRRPWLVGALGVALGGPVGASATGLAACGRLRVSLLPGPGLFERGPNGQSSGLDADIARELSARTGCQFDIEPTNVTRLWRALELGAVDATAGAVYSEARAAQADFLVLARLRGKVLMPRALAERVPERAAFDRDATLRLGVVARARWPAATQAWMDRLRAQGRLSESVDVDSLLRTYEAGRVSALWLLPNVFQGRPSSWLQSQQWLDWFPGDSFQAGWAVSKRVALATRRSLRVAADEAYRDGSMQRIAERNFAPHVLPHISMVAVPAPLPDSAPAAGR